MPSEHHGQIGAWLGAILLATGCFAAIATGLNYLSETKLSAKVTPKKEHNQSSDYTKPASKDHPEASSKHTSTHHAKKNAHIENSEAEYHHTSVKEDEYGVAIESHDEHPETEIEKNKLKNAEIHELKSDSNNSHENLHLKDNHDSHKDEHSSYDNLNKEHHLAWGYEAENGPNSWGQLRHEFTNCSNGKFQSPINLENARWSDVTSAIEFSYTDSPSDITNSIQGLQMEIFTTNTVNIDGHKYSLKSINFHTPSEHLIEGKRYPMEIQLVHEDSDGRTGIIGVLVNSGKRNPLFNDLMARLPTEKGAKSDRLNFSPQKILPERKDFYRYDGSMTIPPCSEGVAWHVFKTPILLSDDQIETFQAFNGKNSRPTQPTYSRSTIFNQTNLAH